MCSTGFGSGAGGVKRLIPPSQMNDGYCDCPFDGGVDELETGACSGATDNGWAGVIITDDKIKPPKFQCKQQPKLLLPHSRLNDGVCDCCDGSDEEHNPNSTTCTDICDEVLAEERAAYTSMVESYNIGSKTRENYVQVYQEIYEKTVQEMNVLNGEIEELEGQIKVHEEEIENQKLHAIGQHFEMVQGVLAGASSSSDTIYLPGTVEQLEMSIVSACHLYGEMTDTAQNSNDDKWGCWALRLAGLDLGILWDKNENDTIIKTGGWFNKETTLEIASVLIEKSQSNSKPETTTLSESSKKDEMDAPKNRKYDGDLDDMDYDMDDDVMLDEDFDDHDYYDGDHHGDDDFVNDYRSEKQQNKNEVKKGNDDFDFSGEEWTVESPLGLLRVPFITQATNIIKYIDSILNKDEPSDDEESSEDSENSEEDSPSIPEGVDPMALQMTRNKLSKTLGIIKRGNDAAISANALLDSLNDSLVESNQQDDYAGIVRNLALLTVYHAKISAADVVDIVSVHDLDMEGDASCLSSQLGVESENINIEDGTKMMFPTGALKEAAENRRRERGNDESTCVVPNNADEIDLSHIPSRIEGFFNYYTVKPRDGNDFYSQALQSLDNDHFQNSDLSKLETTKRALEIRLDSLRSQVSKLDEKIGGKDKSKYGTNGELYVLRDECFEIKGGKYVYELCLFQDANQKEGKSKTALGTWEGINYKKKLGQYVMKWVNGQKCWNGPRRSATVLVTCGKETKILSADEPNMCEYEFRMESPIGCDEKFKKRHIDTY